MSIFDMCPKVSFLPFWPILGRFWTLFFHPPSIFHFTLLLPRRMFISAIFLSKKCDFFSRFLTIFDRFLALFLSLKRDFYSPFFTILSPFYNLFLMYLWSFLTHFWTLFWSFFGHFWTIFWSFFDEKSALNLG